jgi:hypothetical protein
MQFVNETTLHDRALALWWLDRLEEAARVFERLLRLPASPPLRVADLARSVKRPA